MGREESVRGMKAAGFDPAQCEVVKIYESQYSRNAGAKGGVECLVQGLLMDMIGRVFSDTYRAGTGHIPITGTMYEKPVDDLMREHKMSRKEAIMLLNRSVDVVRPGYVMFTYIV